MIAIKESNGSHRHKNGVVPAVVRVAVYTRKSTDEGLDGEFTSLDAQRAAVEAYVTSQRELGWKAIATRYDDGGYSGATTERPAFRRLLADVEARRVDVIAVYKIDRFSRSLTDFTQLIRFLEERSVTFVSVTQQFNTTTSVGRMVLHLLATFAQFERETIQERTKDKMQAARKRGMWTGGHPPLGYDVVDKKLVVNEAEAAHVREIFRWYVATRSLRAVVGEVRRAGLRNKSYVNASGKAVQGGELSKSTVALLLRNPNYAGLVRTKDDVVAGLHTAIVTRETWDQAQALLARDGKRGGPRARREEKAMLLGILKCARCGSDMRDHAATRGKHRYHSYVCARYTRDGATACPGGRVPMGDIEEFVGSKLRSLGRDPAVVRATVAALENDRETRREELAAEIAEAERQRSEAKDGEDPAAIDGRLATLRAEEAGLAVKANEPDVTQALLSFEDLWSELFPAERARLVALTINSIHFDPDRGEVQINYREGGPAALLREAKGERA